MTDDQRRDHRLRVVLEFYRVDQPRLYDDLARFPKGTRRVNRLRFLAQDGLIFEVLRSGTIAGPPAAPPVKQDPGQEGDATVTDVVFENADDA